MNNNEGPVVEFKLHTSPFVFFYLSKKQQLDKINFIPTE